MHTAGENKKCKKGRREGRREEEKREEEKKEQRKGTREGGTDLSVFWPHAIKYPFAKGTFYI